METDQIKARYDRRPVNDTYAFWRPEVHLAVFEKNRAMLEALTTFWGRRDFSNWQVTDIGCGGGSIISDFIRFGCSPSNIIGLELMEDRVAQARATLPSSVRIMNADASLAEIDSESQDLVSQSLVFSSILDREYKRLLAKRIWGWLKVGGGVLWYDFVCDNPKNADVKGIDVSQIRELFPARRMFVRRVTLAPPLSRAVCEINPSLYHVLNAFPFLRTHVVCWIEK